MQKHRNFDRKRNYKNKILIEITTSKENKLSFCRKPKNIEQTVEEREIFKKKLKKPLISFV